MPFHRPYDVYDDTGHNRHNSPENAPTRRAQSRHARAYGTQRDAQQDGVGSGGGSPAYERDENPYAANPYAGGYGHGHGHPHGYTTAGPPANYNGAGTPWTMMDPFQMFENAMGMTSPQVGNNGVSSTPQLFGSMRGMMSSSFDRLFDQMASSSFMQQQQQSGGGGGQTFYYESKSQTIGPDGRVREEVVRTVPGADGRPETRRSVREAASPEQLPHAQFYDRDDGGDGGEMRTTGRRGREAEPDVIVEELDEHGNVISSTDDRRSTSRGREGYAEEDEHAMQTVQEDMDGAMPRDGRSSWWHERYRQWFGHRA